MKTLYRAEGVEHSYALDGQDWPALRGVSLTVGEGEFVCLSGPSGSGKTTLLNLLGLIEPLQRGSLHFAEQNFASLSETEKNQIRRFKIGFIFQSFQLFPVLSAEENVEFFLTRQGLGATERKRRVEEALRSVGLWGLRNKRPAQMSGGQRQRVAVARALAKGPSVILADEPTASLDQATGHALMETFQAMRKKFGVTLVVSSHDPMVQASAGRVIHLQDGHLRDRRLDKGGA